MWQALFLIFNSLNAAKEFTKNLLFFKVVKKVDNFYMEDTGNQIRVVIGGLAR